MMARITGGLFSLVAIVVVLGALWQVNPLYAFIGGIVGIVFLIVLFALIQNQQSPPATVAPPPDIQRRQKETKEVPAIRNTGEFQSVEDVKKPEVDWEDAPAPQSKSQSQVPPPAPPPLEQPPLPPAPSFGGQEQSKKEDNEVDDYTWLDGLDDEASAPEPDIITFGDVDATDESSPTKEVDTFGLITDGDAREETVNRRGSHTQTDEDRIITEEEMEEVNQPVETGSLLPDNPIALAGQLPKDIRQDFLNELFQLPSNRQTPEIIREIFNKYEPHTKKTLKPPVDTAQFTAYYPRQASAGTEYGFYVYTHVPDALVAEDIQQFSKQLGGRVPKPAIAQHTADVQQGAMLTAMVQCDGLQFNQVGAMQKWQAPYVRFDFAFTADEAQIDDIISGRVAILLNMIEIASIDFQVLVGAPNPIAAVTAKPEDPRIGVGYEASATASAYQYIFVSYSRKDTAIAEAYRQAQIMAGNIVFMDTHSIRAGDDWEAALKRFIDNADIFQLFWSPASADSDHVRFEWEYALEQRCPDTRCVRFIRPVYWEKPLPPVPEALGHLHFAYVERT
ncbi:MAG: toll/interleukin-1 receptor domain-containing protein [Chloroflexota bacterium]